jgi:hypothetical protein
MDPFVPLHPVGLEKLVEEMTGGGVTITVVVAGSEVQLLRVAVTE